MTRLLQIRMVAVLLTATHCAVFASSLADKAGEIFPWFNTTIPRADRVAALVAAMTIDEKIAWLNDAAPAITRLGIPAYSWEGEASHGVAWAGVATAFPSPIAWGAAFDSDLPVGIGRVIAVEARAKWVDGRAPDGSSTEFHGLSFMVPNSNLFVDPRWGRGQETMGEDPLLTFTMTRAFIGALQGTVGNTSLADYTTMLATMKHYLGYHLESFGSENQYRLSHSFNYTSTDVAQYYSKPFAAAVDAGVASVMCA